MSNGILFVTVDGERPSQTALKLDDISSVSLHRETPVLESYPKDAFEVEVRFIRGGSEWFYGLDRESAVKLYSTIVGTMQP